MNTAAIRAFMARKFLGIPAGVFVVIFAGVLLFVAIRMKSSDTTAADSTDTTDTPSGDAGPTDDTQQPDFSAVPSDGSTATPVITTVATNDTNDAWQRRAITWLMGNGYSVEIATTAINKYLNGGKLTTQEAKARDAAITQFGLPPESIPDSLLAPEGILAPLMRLPVSKGSRLLITTSRVIGITLPQNSPYCITGLTARMLRTRSRRLTTLRCRRMLSVLRFVSRKTTFLTSTSPRLILKRSTILPARMA